MLGVGVAYKVHLICVIVLDCKYIFHVLHVRYVLVITMLQVVSIC